MRKIFFCLALTLSLTSFANGASLLGLYEFENNLDDTSAGGLNGGANAGGMVFDAAGASGSAAKFDGTGIGVVVPIDVSPGTMPSVTIGGWVQATGTGTVWGEHDGGWDRGVYSSGSLWELYVNENEMESRISTTTASQPWQFVAVTFKVDPLGRGQSGSLTVDENIIYSAAGPNGGSTRTSMAIGSLDPVGVVRPFNGLIDSVFVYDGALSAKQIEAVRLAGPSAVPQTLVENLNPRTTQMTWDFETGTLAGWNILAGSGTAFDNQPNNVAPAEGSFDIDTFNGNGSQNLDIATGVLRTDPFVLGPNANFDFLVSGGKVVFNGDPDAAVLDGANGMTLERLVSPGDWEVLFNSAAIRTNSNWPTFWDAGRYEGETVRLSIYDTRTSGWAGTGVDSIVYTTATAVPEPGSLVLAGLFALSFVGFSSRRNR